MANFTENAIRTAFLELLNERPLSKITVKDITDRCGINRNTFYYHFQDIPTLIQQIFTVEANNIITQYSSIDTLENAVSISISNLLKNKKAILHIYNSANREMFEQYFFTICGHTVRTYMKTAFPEKNISDSDRELIADYYQSALFGSLLVWLQKGMKDDIEQKIQRIFELKKGFTEELILRCILQNGEET